MNAAYDVHVLVVNGIPLEVLLVELQDGADVFVGIVDGFVLDLVFAFTANQLSRKLCLIRCVLGVVNGPMR